MKAARVLTVVSLSLLAAACAGGGSRGPAPVVAPTSLAAEVRATSVSLTWIDESPSESGFAIERAKGDAEFERVATVAPDVTVYEDERLVPSTVYRYRVYALFSGGGDVASDVLSVTTKSPTLFQVLPAAVFDVGGQRVSIRGDGFRAGVDEVRFNNVPATELKVVDDSTLLCTTPASATTGFSSVSVVMGETTLQVIDAYSYYPWPPKDQATPDDIRVGAAAEPADVQMLVDGSVATMIWGEDKPYRALFASRGRAGSPWEEPVRLSSASARPWQPHAAVDGTDVYVVWVDFGSLYIVKSRDNGGSWSAPTQIPADLGSVFEPRVLVQGGRVHVAWSDQRSLHGELYHSYSDDGGATFRLVAVRANTVLGVSGLQVAADGQDIYLVWRNPQAGGGIYFNKSTDNGATWTERDQRLAFDAGSAQPSPLQLTVNGGRIFVLSEELSGKRIAIVRSTDRGTTFGPKVRLDRDDRVSRSPRLAVTPGGDEVYVVWQETELSGKESAVELNRSLDGGATYLRWPAVVATVKGSTSLDPVVCCNRQIVTVAFTGESAGGSQVFVNSSAEWGLRWQPVDLQLSKREAARPKIYGTGAEIVIGWTGIDSAQGTHALRAVRTVAR